MEWQYPSDINPLDHEGFIYCVTNLISGRQYIGRKYIYRWSKGKIVGESNWRDYWGSSKILCADIENLGVHNFKREIILFCRTKAETNFREVDEQFKRSVLTALLPNGERAYYNENIMSKYFARNAASYEAAREKVSKGIKRWFEQNQHPMTGKVHPNKAKKINTGHTKNVGKRHYTDGATNVTLGGDETPPTGFEPGLTVKERPVSASRVAYDANPKRCRCGEAISFQWRNYQTHCSKTCAGVTHSEKLAGKPFKGVPDSKKSGASKRAAIARRCGFETAELMRDYVQEANKAGTPLKVLSEKLGCSYSFVRTLNSTPKD
jgi:hypothetical protein